MSHVQSVLADDVWSLAQKHLDSLQKSHRELFVQIVYSDKWINIGFISQQCLINIK